MPLIYKVLERSRCQSVSPNNSAILLWNLVVLLDNICNYSPNYCTLYHLLNSKNNQVRITFTLFGSKMRIASCTRDWPHQDLHVLTAHFICGPKLSSLLYVSNYISLEQCPRGKSRVKILLLLKWIKSSTKHKKELKQISQGGKWRLTSELENLANFQTWYVQLCNYTASFCLVN